MKTSAPWILFLLLLAGCETRSISDSEYRNSYGWARTANSLYKGELTEIDILGAANRQEATEASIAKALETLTPPQIKHGEKVILIQSGAQMPDNAMLDAAGRYFSIAPFSGIPPENKTGMSESLRFRAAQGGYRYILCYWGILESAREEREGNSVSWVPIVGAFVPDQKQKVRIRLKALLMDVATGSWKMLTPEVYTDESFNSRWTRESSDQKLVHELKGKGYQRLISDVLKD